MTAFSKYISTRGQAPLVSFKDSLFTGLAPDGGLYIPNRIPWFTASGLVGMKDLSYADLAIEILYPFVSENIPVRDFSKVVNHSVKLFSGGDSLTKVDGGDGIGSESTIQATRENVIEVPAPLRKLDDNLALLELFHGPTLAFKDFALQLLAGLMDYFLRQEKQKILIIGATSGDTGSATIEAFRHYPDIKIVILHPHNKVTPFQRRQMTSTGSDNVWNLAVEGNFDDCQQLVKDCFNGREFLPTDHNLTAVNSINWARIMAQIVYYFSAFFQAGCNFKRKHCFVVPTGNFGNVLAGYYAKSMGLPIEKLLVAVNQNDILHRFFSNNNYSVTDMKPTYSPSMDILVSSNFERLIYLLNSPFYQPNNVFNMMYLSNTENSGKTLNRLMREFSNSKKLRVDKEIWEKARESFFSDTCSDEETQETIARCYRNYGVVVDPHTAVGLKAAHSLSESDPDMYNIVLATAHPAKFSEVILKAKVPLSPNPYQNIDAKPEKFKNFPNDFDQLKKYLLEQVIH